MSIPNLTLLAPRDTDAIRTSMGIALQVDGPSVIQYPKDGIEPYAKDLAGEPLAVGKWQTLREGNDCTILAYGRMVKFAMEAAQLLEKEDIQISVIDAWSLRPMDMDCLRTLFEKKAKIITVEEGEMIGGFGSEIARLCVEYGASQPAAIMGLPNRFIAHGSVDQLLEECGLTVENIAQRVRAAVAK